MKKEYLKPKVSILELNTEAILCLSFTGMNGGQDGDGNQLPGYDEEQFPW